MLRRRLREMSAIANVYRHPALLRRLSRYCPNSIRVLSSPWPVYRYNCLMYALHFAERPEYITIAGYGDGRAFAGADFAHWLLDRRYLLPSSSAPATEGDLVFYFNADRFRHAGIRRADGRIESKWGVGQLYEHGPFEVPDCYGDALCGYCRPTPAAAFAAFAEFAAAQGVPERVLALARTLALTAVTDTEILH